MGITVLTYMDTRPPFQCSTGKMVYVSSREARHASRTMANYKGKRRPYICPECSAWHLTSRANKSRRHRRAEKRRAVVTGAA